MSIITGKDLFIDTIWRPISRHTKQILESNPEKQRTSWKDFASLL
jgi:hypothetical protein